MLLLLVVVGALFLFLLFLCPATINKRRHCGTNIAHRIVAPRNISNEKRTQFASNVNEMCPQHSGIFRLIRDEILIFVCKRERARALSLRVDGSTSLRKCYYCNDVFVLGQSNEIEPGFRSSFFFSSFFSFHLTLLLPMPPPLLADVRVAKSTHAFS